MRRFWRRISLALALGGVVAKVGDVVYDGSLRTQLRVLRDELSR